jgi:hypothetical protein
MRACGRDCSAGGRQVTADGEVDGVVVAATRDSRGSPTRGPLPWRATSRAGGPWSQTAGSLPPARPSPSRCESRRPRNRAGAQAPSIVPISSPARPQRGAGRPGRLRRGSESSVAGRRTSGSTTNSRRSSRAHPVAGQRRVARPRVPPPARRRALRARRREDRVNGRSLSKSTSCCSARSSVADHHAAAGARLTASATGHSTSATRASASRRSRSSGSCQYIANVTASARAARNDVGSRATASAAKSLRATAAVNAAAKVKTPADSGGSSNVQPPVRVSNSQQTRRPRGPAKRTSGSRAAAVTFRQVRSRPPRR